MNTYQAFEKFLTCAAVVGGVACTAFVLCWTLRRELRAALDRWLALGPAGRCATALFASVCVIYGSTIASEYMSDCSESRPALATSGAM